ncbi:MAG: anti-sigma factor [Actinomycetota bacterium]
MPFSEDDLRAALKRKDPGPEFTQRVMARLNERDAQSRERTRARSGWRMPWLRLGPVLAAAAVIVMLIAGVWIGYQSQQQHERDAQNRKHRQELAEERAREQTILALRITSEKLNHVLQKVNGALPQDVRIRRERL